ncbi:MAG: hypothetical protein WB609_08940 [Candidatus Cybelea sp.]
MKSSDCGHVALSIFIATAMLAGCGGSQPPIVGSGSMPQNGTIAMHAGHGGSWMRPEAKGRDLLYIALGNEVNVYTYPRGGLLGSLGVGGLYLCTDRANNVFIPAGLFGTQILVYAHGAITPKVTLNDPYAAVDCSVDPTSETLAVTEGFGGGIVIFPYSQKRGWRYAKSYADPDMQSITFCTYDKNGDLFVDGGGSSGGFRLAELQKGSKTFTTITLDQTISAAGSMQWDGKYLAIADLGTGSSSPSVIYRFALSGSSGTKVSKTTLQLSYARAQFWIQGSTVIGPIAYDSVRAFGFWRFPAGGSPVKSFSDQAPSGEAVSLK